MAQPSQHPQPSGPARPTGRTTGNRDVLATLAAELAPLLPADAVITDPTRLATYDCDGLTSYRAIPGLVVLPESTDQVAAVIRACARAGVPFVARGSGTGLSGGALPHTEGVLVVTSRMRQVIEIDAAAERAVLQPGVTNLEVTRQASPHGYYYAPDPSSQQVCSIGGNVAENSGGAHCLKYGFTTHHVLGLELVTPAGEVLRVGGRAPEQPGYDLLGVLVGSEGTLGVATEVTVRLTRAPERVRTLLAAFRNTDGAGEATSAIIAAGLVPAAIEIMDALAIEAAEQAVQCNYPAGAGAVLVVELDGAAEEVDAELATAQQICTEQGCYELRVAADEDERARIWKGRKSAFAAVGRISPDYIVQDGVVPRTALPAVLRAIGAAAGEGVRVANVFHAGDGNLHPLVLFDAAVPGRQEQAERVSAAILQLCIDHGGSITGEHGVGVDKAQYMPKLFSDDDLDTMQLVRCAFDPDGIANPGKVFPTPRLCGEAPGQRRGVHPLVAQGLADQL
jgi:glycolate oxidase